MNDQDRECLQNQIDELRISLSKAFDEIASLTVDLEYMHARFETRLSNLED